VTTDPAGTSNTIGGGMFTAPVLQAARDIQATFQVPAPVPTGGTQKPPVLQGRHISSITFGKPPTAAPSASPY
jgi:hypothetical protein